MSSTTAYEPVANFYAGKSIFITGGTGFLGKVLIEKLLYSCPKLDKIYTLVREKKSQSPEKRLQNMIELPMFARLRKERPEDLRKIVPVVGDITEPDLGIKEEDQEVLLEKVNVVFHVAATVLFNEPLRVSMDQNFEGTKRTLNISKKMKNLQAFVYVSTAYSNTTREEIKEVVYPPPALYDDVYAALEKHGDDEKEIKLILNGQPNTYTFTKAPSIVMGSKTEPIEGWVDNWFGANGTMTMIGKGYIRVLLGKGSNILDMIPVDYVSNLVVVAAAKCKGSKEILVYNSCSSTANPVTLESTCRYFIAETVNLKLNDIPYPTITFSKYQWLVKIIIFIIQTIPAFIMDCFQLLMGKEPRYQKLQAKLQRLQNSQEYFTSNSWLIHSEQTQALYASLSESDKSHFKFDPCDIVWSQYISVCYKGIKTYLF
ncbi:unnamed protein product, partial [Iphiclides podalirius]